MIRHMITLTLFFSAGVSAEQAQQPASEQEQTKTEITRIKKHDNYLFHPIEITEDHSIWLSWEKTFYPKENKRLTYEEKREIIRSVYEDWLPELKQKSPKLWQSYYNAAKDETALVLLLMGRSIYWNQPLW